MKRCQRVICVVLDSAGCGALPDAEQYGDAGAHTLGHIIERTGVPLLHMRRLGLGELLGIPPLPVGAPRGAYGRLREKSPGKDTTTGHWELMGIQLDAPFPTFPHGFPERFVQAFSARTGRGVLCNAPASGTQIIAELGEEHRRTGAWILYTSADSVCQIAAHECVVPLEELYAACRVARELLTGELAVGRVIARPFIGEAGAFVRTANRHDFSLPPPGETVLDRLQQAGEIVYGIGKIQDIFAGRGVSHSVPTKSNAMGIAEIERALEKLPSGFLFANLVDFDMLYGHRRDVRGYADALAEFDAALPVFLGKLRPDDLLLITADHGCDPTHAGTDHTREAPPVLAAGPRVRACALGDRGSFADLGQTVLEALGAPPLEFGISFFREIMQS